MTQFTSDAVDAVREMTDLSVEIAVDDQDYCKLLIGECTIIEAHFGKMPTLSLDGWDGATWTFGTIYDAAEAAEVIEEAHGKLTSMARKSITEKMRLDTIHKFWEVTA